MDIPITATRHCAEVAQCIKCKTYDWVKHGLLMTSEQLLKFCTHFEKVAQINLEKLSYGRNMMQNLKDCVAECVDLNSLQLDFVCQEQAAIDRNQFLQSIADNIRSLLYTTIVVTYCSCYLTVGPLPSEHIMTVLQRHTE